MYHDGVDGGSRIKIIRHGMIRLGPAQKGPFHVLSSGPKVFQLQMGERVHGQGQQGPSQVPQGSIAEPALAALYVAAADPRARLLVTRVSKVLVTNVPVGV